MGDVRDRRWRRLWRTRGRETGRGRIEDGSCQREKWMRNYIESEEAGNML